MNTNDKLLLLGVTPPRLMAVSVDGKSISALVPNTGGTPDGIAVDYLNHRIYWTNMGEDWSKNDGFIERIDFDGSNREVVVKCGDTYTPKQMIVDAEHDYLYWCDREGMRVMRSRLNGDEITTLVQTGATATDRADERLHCVGIAIDHAHGLLYWTQKGPPNGGMGRVLRAGLALPAGTSPAMRTDIEIVLDKLPEPIDLEWDATNRYLYWTDRGDPPLGNTLNRVRIIDGKTGNPEILLGNLEEGIGLAVDPRQNRAFVSDLGGNIRLVSLDNACQGEVILAQQGPLTGIAYLEGDR